MDFDKKAYETYDKKAKESVRKHLDSMGILTQVLEDYGPDIKALHSFFHEVEIKPAWEEEWPSHWKPLHIPSRKKKYLNDGKKGYFWVLNNTCTKAKVIKSDCLQDEYLEVIHNKRTAEGELFYDIPVHLSKEINFV